LVLVAKITPPYKKSSMLDPNSYRMLAFSGTMYRLQYSHSMRMKFAQCANEINE